MDILSFLLGRITADGSGGGGGSEAVLIDKTISSNGVYNASDDNADGYKKVTAQVPNSYDAADEGKVVSSGALVSQTAHADVTPTTSDQTIDTTLNNSIKVIGDADLVAGNIKKDVQIFGVTGSYEGSGGGGITPDGMADRSEPNGSIVLTTNTIAAQAFTGCVNLTNVGVDSVTSLGNYAFANCTKLGVLHFKALTSSLPGNNYIFSGAGKIDQTIIVLPRITSIGSRMFRYAQLLKADLGPGVSAIGADSFYSNTGGVICQTLILRRTEDVVSASTVEAINGLRDVYVPQALMSDYTNASNWSTKISAGIITLHAIEGSIYQNDYADGTPIT